jgi:hypothetical protein
VRGPADALEQRRSPRRHRPVGEVRQRRLGEPGGERRNSAITRFMLEEYFEPPASLFAS